jgi:hypothetical protein
LELCSKYILVKGLGNGDKIERRCKKEKRLETSIRKHVNMEDNITERK